MKILIKIITILSLSSLALYANVATITALKGSVQVQSDSSTKSAALGTELKESDTVITADKSKAQIIFKDETIVTIGKNSHFSIAKYIYDDAGEATVEFGLLKGAMKTITGRIGKIAPQRFKVKTKTATIGIRGTNFVVIIEDDGTQRAYCTYGAISVTVNGEEYIVKQGFYLVLSPDGKVEVREFTPDELQKMKNDNFGKRVALKDKNLNDNLGNKKILDNTRDDIGSLVVKDISEENADAVQLSASLSDLLAGYTMSDAHYTGTYVVTETSGGTNLPESGIANLDIDFGGDTLTLILDPSGENATFDVNPSFGSTDFTVTQAAGGAMTPGSAAGTFKEPTGNDVSGTFNYNQNSDDYSNGTYDVSTEQTLH